jgi:hypothetical protein
MGGLGAGGGEEAELQSFLTSALDGGDWSNSRLGRFTHKRKTLVPTQQDAGWAPAPIWTFRKTEKSVAPTRNPTSGV